MKRIPLFLFITAIFSIALMAVFTAFYFYEYSEKSREAKTAIQRHFLFANTIFMQWQTGASLLAIESLARRYGMRMVRDKQESRTILRQATLIGHKSFQSGSLDLLHHDNRYFLLITVWRGRVLFEDMVAEVSGGILIWSTFGASALLLIALYLMLLAKLRPLQTMQKAIDRFGGGDFRARTDIQGSDEIAKVAQAFDTAIGQIETLIESRNLFMRNIMHELKTPLAKGMLSVEMLETSKQKERLQNIFMRLDGLINEFAAVEKLNTGDMPLKPHLFNLQDIIDESMGLAMISRESGEFTIENDKVMVDFKLFCIALKNLIDNAVKYSPDHRFQLCADKREITVINRGSPLDEDLLKFKAYGGGVKTKGLGLGLYIADTIAKAHGFRLEYRHQEGCNRFKILLDTPSGET